MLRLEIIKLLEENIGEILHKIGLGLDFFGHAPKSIGNKVREEKSVIISN